MKKAFRYENGDELILTEKSIQALANEDAADLLPAFTERLTLQMLVKLCDGMVKMTETHLQTARMQLVMMYGKFDIIPMSEVAALIADDEYTKLFIINFFSLLKEKALKESVLRKKDE